MTKGDLDAIRLWGRPLKPVALGLAILMVTLTVVNLIDIGRFGDLFLGDMVAVMAGTAALLLTAGWVANNQHFAEWGMLLACVVYVIRCAFLTFMFGPGDEGIWLGIGAAVIAGGAYLLETTDPHKSGMARTRATDRRE